MALALNDRAARLVGAPLIRFSEPLDAAVFDRWISTLRRKKTAFGSGDPLLGGREVHLTGRQSPVHRLTLRSTARPLYGYSPPARAQYRPSTRDENQRLVDPKVSVFVGNSIEHFVGGAANGVEARG